MILYILALLLALKVGGTFYAHPMYKQGTYLERPLSESLDKTDVKDDQRCVWKTRGNLVVKEVHRLCTMVAKVVGRFCSKLASIITMCAKLCGQRFSCIDHTWLEFQIPVLQVALPDRYSAEFWTRFVLETLCA